MFKKTKNNTAAVELTSQENVTFRDDKSSQNRMMGFDQLDQSKLLGGAPSRSTLATWLSRPVTIYNHVWNLNLDATLYPWHHYLSRAEVVEKINHFHLFRGTLVVKILINASQFHYGRAIATYEPLERLCGSSSLSSASLNVTRSQLPHINIDLADTETAEMRIPFVWYNDYIATTDLDDHSKDLGTMRLISLVRVRQSNDGSTTGVSTTPATLNVLAWMEDVELKVPTWQNISMTPIAVFEAHGGVDESETKLSDKATALAKAAESVAPVVGPFATATQWVSTAVAETAKMLGYSKPVDTTYMGVHPKLYDSFTNVSGEFKGHVLAVDKKTGVAIGTAALGVADEDDPLAIENIISKPALVRTILWTDSDVAGNVLAVVGVHPMLCSIGVSGDEYSVSHSPLSFVASMFQYWRGSIKLKFQVVSSKQHQGRIMLRYSPQHGAGGGFDYSNMNLFYTEVIDMSTTMETEMIIPWCEASHMLHTAPFDELPSADVKYLNGVVEVVVLNELSGPSDAPVEILMWIAGSDDMRFAVPKIGELGYPTAFTEAFSDFTGNGDMDTEDCCEATAFHGKEVSNQDSLLFGGENITSLRQLLRRANAYSSFAVPGQVGATKDGYDMEYILPSYPLKNGTAVAYPKPNGKHEHWAPANAHNLLSPCFVTRRGAIRWHISPKYNASASGNLMATRSYSGDPTSDVSLTSNNSPADRVGQFFQTRHQTANGAALYNLNVFNDVEVEVPFYSRYRFFPAGLSDEEFLTHVEDSRAKVKISHSMLAIDPHTATQHDVFYSVGEDFTFNLFKGIPRLHYKRSYP